MKTAIKPTKWDARRDALACCGCGEPFRKNDLVYPRDLTGAVTVHYRRGCAEMYNSDVWSEPEGQEARKADGKPN